MRLSFTRSAAKAKQKIKPARKKTQEGKWATYLAAIAYVVSVYLLAAVFTSFTGSIGKRASELILKAAGGAFVIPLLFVIYVSVSKLLSKEVQNFCKQSFATLIMFILAALILGLGDLTGALSDTAPRFLNQGELGGLLARGLTSSLGALGTFLCGAFLLYFAMALYQIPMFPNIKLPKWIRLRKGGNTVPQSGGARGKPAGGGPDGETLNISEYDGENYFGMLADEKDASPLSKRAGAKKDAAGSGALNQDPEFNLNDGEKLNFTKGVFPPPIEIFGREESHEGEVTEEKAMPLGERIVGALEEFGIESKLAEILVGPTVIQFRIQLAPGVKVSRVSALSSDLALALAVPSLRIEAPIPGKPYVGVEIPNPKRRGIPLRTIAEDPAYTDNNYVLPLPFGVAVNGDSVVVGLETLPHLLIAGTTGSGKSVFVNSCIVGLCSRRPPSELRMILVDPKRVEMAVYDKLPHLLTPPVTDTKKAVHVLAWAIREMESRYESFARARVRNLEAYNEKVFPKDRLPSIVIVVDELADLMMTAAKEVEDHICRLAQMARATGIHLILATQRPSVNVITGLIKANIPARVAFTLPSNADSRTIIDAVGAEKLLGKGDMLFLTTKYPKPVRVQSPWVSEEVLGNWLSYLSNLFGAPEFIDIDKQGAGAGGAASGDFDDDLLDSAVENVMKTGIASASGLQRRLHVGFSRASRLIDMMEELGIVGPADGSKPREILVDEDEAGELLGNVRNCD